mmetsp:Transcript_7261/g.22876  ORF Transcript_7261/g.22876 Transcript_7261/m.22876 type:complete len:204 (+) Transcript_7261:73-684(+)|eukprot:CAMPEP_0185334632 /NCGR_PEP_ID=MMETSP1363-20130426/85789_1 /TAXON_ID=38817 /ORGANISM="Gephyrocapsa oceanica, Strain RCC1303" /LENGTH=203 /DNA_ID=CAMNT_0027933629 /DNA_START=41 /DNA_END=652 /DNA_ORIENTATION=-
MRPFVLFLVLMATPAFARTGLGVDVCDMSPVQAWLSASGLAAPAELPELKEVMFSGDEDICGKSFVGNKLFGSAPDVSWGGRLDSIPLAHHLKHTVVLLDIDAEDGPYLHMLVTDARKGNVWRGSTMSMKYQPPRATRDAHRYVFLLLQQQQGHTVLQLPRGESRHSDREAWSLERFLAHNGGRLTLAAASWFSYKGKDKTEL